MGQGRSTPRFSFFPQPGSPVDLAILTDEISLDLDEALREGHQLGFKKYELRCVDSYDHRVPNLNEGVEARLASEVQKGSIEITALTPGFFKLGLAEKDTIKQQLDSELPKTCEMANRLNAPRIIVFGFMRKDGGHRDDTLPLLKEAGAIADSYGLELSIENEPGFFCDTGVNTVKTVQAIGADNVGINWDPGNAVSSGEAAYPVGYEVVRPFLQNVHIKDTIPIPPDKWENKLIGDGGVNWLGQLRALLKDKPIDHLTLETHVFPILESTREDVRRLKILMDAVDALDEGGE